MQAFKPGLHPHRTCRHTGLREEGEASLIHGLGPLTIALLSKEMAEMCIGRRLAGGAAEAIVER